MPRVFVNYRRHDTAGHAGRLYDRLASEFGEKNVFIDVDAIEVGTDFVERIHDSVEQCDAVLAVIGRGWLEEESEGQRRIDDSNDFVRVELEAALRSDVTVIPVLVHGAEMPPTEELPEELQALARRQAIELADARWNHDVGKLIGAVKQIASRRAKRERERARRAAAREAAVDQAETRPVVKHHVGRTHWLALAAAILGAAVIGVAVAGGSDEQPPSNVTARNLGLTADSSWQETSLAAVPGLELENSVSLQYRGAPDSLLVAGEVTDPQPGLDPLPSSLERQFTAPPKRGTVQLADKGAYSYDGQIQTGSADGDRSRVRVFMVPTERGYEAIACLAQPTNFAAFIPACAEVAGSARIAGALDDGVAPSRGLAESLSSTIGDLNEARESGLQALSDAKTPTAQNKAAASLAAAHEKAAGQVGELESSPRDENAVAALEAALSDLAAGFSALASAADAGASAKFAAGSDAIDDADVALHDSLRDLARLGYELD